MKLQCLITNSHQFHIYSIFVCFSTAGCLLKNFVDLKILLLFGLKILQCVTTKCGMSLGTTKIFVSVYVKLGGAEV